MRMRSFLCGLVSLALSGCASAPDSFRETRSDAVDQRLLSPSVAGGGAGKIEAYTLRPQQAFRMPLLHDNVDPALPADTPRQTLASTTVCVRVIVDAQGAVQRTEPLLDRAECNAGSDAANADLLQAVNTAARTWRYAPAAICYYRGVAPPHPGDCADADRVEPVPVTLHYAFTFQMERGQVRVRHDGGAGR